MAWSEAGQDRWKIAEDPGRHILLKDGRDYLELHGAYVHVYSGPDEVADAGWPMGNPATMGDDDPPVVTHVRTDHLEEALEVPDEDVWEWLAGREWEARDGV